MDVAGEESGAGQLEREHAVLTTHEMASIPEASAPRVTP